MVSSIFFNSKGRAQEGNKEYLRVLRISIAVTTRVADPSDYQARATPKQNIYMTTQLSAKDPPAPFSPTS